MADLVPVRAPDGTIGTVPVERAQAALEQGYEQVTPEEYQRADLQARRGTLGQTVLAGAEGAARGLTFGLSDLAGRAALGRDWAHAAAERRAANPTAATVGEIGGAVAPAVLSGGAGEALGLGMRGAEAAGGLAERGVAAVVGEGAESLAGRAAQHALRLGARGAVEGAIYGAGGGISEAALGDDPLTAERLYAAAAEHAKKGALFGGALGAGGGALGEVGKAVFRIGDQDGLQNYLESAITTRTLKALGASKADMARMGNVASEAQAKATALARTALDYRFEDGSRLFDALQSPEELAEKAEKALAIEGKKIGAIREAAQATGVMPDIEALGKRIDEEIIAPLRASEVPELQARADKLENTFLGLRTKPNAALKDLTDFRQNLDRVLYPQAKGLRGLPPVPPEHASELIQARALAEKEIEATTDRAAEQVGTPDMLADYQEAKQQYSNLKNIVALTSKKLTQSGNRFISPSDYIVGGLAGEAASHAMHGLGEGGLVGAGAALAHHYLREHGSAIAARTLDTIAGLSERNAQAIQRVESGVDRALAASHTVAFKGGPLIAPTLGLAQNRPMTVEGVAAQLRTSQSDPAALHERTAEHVAPIAEAAPKTAVALTGVSQRATQYLASKLPPPRLDPLSPPNVRMNAAQRATFSQQMRGANAPLSVARDLARGTLTRAQVEAMHAATPALHDDIVKRALDKAATVVGRGKRPNYRQRIQLSILTGQPQDATMRPEFIARLQAMYKSQEQTKPAPPPSGVPKRKLDTAADYTTAAERIGRLK